MPITYTTSEIRLGANSLNWQRCPSTRYTTLFRAHTKFGIFTVKNCEEQGYFDVELDNKYPSLSTPLVPDDEYPSLEAAMQAAYDIYDDLVTTIFKGCMRIMPE